MNKVDREYFRLLNLVLENGKTKKNRTGIDTIGVFGEQAKFDIDLNNFPILTTKKVFWKGIVHELLWFIKGDTNIKYLVDNDVHIWDEWAYKRFVERGTPKDINSQNKFVTSLKNLSANDSWVREWGNLGEGTYGGMWRNFPFHQAEYSGWAKNNINWTGIDFKFGIDQLKNIVEKLKIGSDDRRLIVSAWHPYLVDNCALPPCHCLFQFHTEKLTLEERENIFSKTVFQEYGQGSPYDCLIVLPDIEKVKHERLDTFNIPKRRLNCQLYQRSCDLFLGVPFNITSYCLLTSLIAHSVNMIPGQFIHTYGDLHIYSNHLEQVKLQLTKEPKDLPKLWLNPNIKCLFDFKYDDIRLENYNPHPTIKGDVAV